MDGGIFYAFLLNSNSDLKKSQFESVNIFYEFELKISYSLKLYIKSNFDPEVNQGSFIHLYQSQFSQSFTRFI